jgi:hypothetical protein
MFSSRRVDSLTEADFWTRKIRDVQEFLYGYDVAAETEKRFAELIATVGKK